MKKQALLSLLALATLLLSGCGSYFDEEYVVVSDYVPAVSDSAPSGDKILVRSFAELRRALLSLVGEGKTAGNIVFDTAYEGDITEDMASACWQVRTQDALCAYRVANIAYELSKIVTYSEANISISYSDAALDTEDIIRMQFSTGLDDLLRQAMEAGKTRLAVLVSQSFYSQENVENEVTEVYRSKPSIAPQEPEVDVNMFSGTGSQRLYEINLDYGMTAEELADFRDQMRRFDPFPEMDTSQMSAGLRALTACQYLMAHCRYTEDAGANGLNAALLGGEANSEGMALAYVDLCARLGLECQVIDGQRNWKDCYWNLVQIDGDYYHVDVPVCTEDGLEKAFLLSDEIAWNSYRWDVAAYPRCIGPLRYKDLLSENTAPADTLEENQEESKNNT